MPGNITFTSFLTYGFHIIIYQQHIQYNHFWVVHFLKDSRRPLQWPNLLFSLSAPNEHTNIHHMTVVMKTKWQTKQLTSCLLLLFFISMSDMPHLLQELLIDLASTYVPFRIFSNKLVEIYLWYYRSQWRYSQHSATIHGDIANTTVDRFSWNEYYKTDWYTIELWYAVHTFKWMFATGSIW